VVLGGNPVAAWPDQLMTIKAMETLELLVTIDIRMSQTAELAHWQPLSPPQSTAQSAHRNSFRTSSASSETDIPVTECGAAVLLDKIGAN
jgi:hypothetical protein